MLIWIKNHFGHPLSCRRIPVSLFEDIGVFHKRYDSNRSDPRRAYVAKVLDFIGQAPKSIIDVHGKKFDHFLRHQSLQFSLCTEKAWQQLTGYFNLTAFPDWKSYSELKAMQPYQRTFNLPARKKFKSNVFQYPKDVPSVHPTQKPVALLADLIETYSLPGDTVLDFTMGSGSTGVACIYTNRDFIGIEANADYFARAKMRLHQAKMRRPLYAKTQTAA